MLSKEGEIRRDDHCIDFAGTNIILFGCHGGGGNQKWNYSHESRTLRHPASSKCLALAESKDKLVMEPCSQEEGRQRWSFQTYNASLAKTR